jgi:hypothetical protein
MSSYVTALLEFIHKNILIWPPTAITILGTLHLLGGVLAEIVILVYLTTGTYSGGSYYVGPNPVFIIAGPIGAFCIGLFGVLVLKKSLWFGYVPILLMLLGSLMLMAMLVVENYRYHHYGWMGMLGDIFLPLVYFMIVGVLCLLAWEPMTN